MTTTLDDIDEGISEEELLEKGLSVENIVGTLDLRSEFDLAILHKDLENVEYEPETHPFLVYRPDHTIGVITLPTNGKASLVGCKSKEEMARLGNHLSDLLSELTGKEMPTPSEIEVQNIVIQGDIEHELDLGPIVTLLGTANAEYEPEQFPGVIYRPYGDRNTTLLIFGSGKYMVNGATSYAEAVSTIEDMLERFSEDDVPGEY